RGEESVGERERERRDEEGVEERERERKGETESVGERERGETEREWKRWRERGSKKAGRERKRWRERERRGEQAFGRGESERQKTDVRDANCLLCNLVYYGSFSSTLQTKCKLYFRELPNPLLTSQLYERF